MPLFKWTRKGDSRLGRTVLHLEMDFNFPVIIVGMIFSGVGFVYFSYGKRMQKPNLLICGLILMIYPYLFDGMMGTVLVGALLSGIPFLLKWW